MGVIKAHKNRMMLVSINETISVELRKEVETDGGMGIWIYHDTSKVGLKLETLNKIHAIVNSNLETAKILFGDKK